MEQIFFKYNKIDEDMKNHPEFMLVDYSRIDGYPMFKITIELEKSFINKIINLKNSNEEHIIIINNYLRYIKIDCILNKRLLDKKMQKFINFIQFISDNSNAIEFVSKLEDYLIY